MALLVLLVASTAVAAPEPIAPIAPGMEGAKRAAEAKLVEGVGLLKDRRYREALQSFQDAYALVPSPLISYDFGLAYLGLGDDPRALESFEAFLGQARDAPVEKRRKAERYRDELRGRLARAPVPGPSVVAAPTVTAPNPTAVPTPAPPAFAPTPVPGPYRADAVEAAQPRQPPQPPLPAPRVGPWALSVAALGAASAGVGLAFGVMAQNDGDALTDDSRNRRVFTPDVEASGLRHQQLETIFLSVGAAAILAGVGLYALARHRAGAAGPASPGAP